MSQKGIDFEIIWKKLNAELSEEEETAFAEWLEDEEHRAYFERVQSQYNVDSAERKIKVPSLAQLKGDQEFRWARKVVYPLGAVAFLVFAIIYFLSPKQETPQESQVVENPILPGTDKAILITSSGESIEINAKTAVDVKDAQVSVKADGKSLVYTNADGGDHSKAMNTLMIPKGGKFSLVLSDGTKVWVNSDTRLEYPVAFAKNERKVYLEGEAYFEVTHDPDRPFTVSSEGQHVQVLGTSFNISSYKETGIAVTTLVEGSVDVVSRKTATVKNLIPGMQSSLNTVTGEIASREVDVDLFVSWKDGWFVFDDQSLEEILNTLSRWYNVDVFFVNSDAKEMKFTGDIERHENIENIISLIERTNAVKIEIKDRTVIVR